MFYLSYLALTQHKKQMSAQEHSYRHLRLATETSANHCHQFRNLKCMASIDPSSGKQREAAAPCRSVSGP